jgi:hypothetical protein
MENHVPTVNKILKADNLLSSLNKFDSGGLQARSKEQGLGPCRAGVRGFESHPPHFSVFLFSCSCEKLLSTSTSLGLCGLLGFVFCACSGLCSGCVRVVTKDVKIK